MNGYQVTWTYDDGETETEQATELTLMELVRQCLMRPSIRKFEVVKL